MDRPWADTVYLEKKKVCMDANMLVGMAKRKGFVMPACHVPAAKRGEYMNGGGHWSATRLQLGVE